MKTNTSLHNNNENNILFDISVHNGTRSLRYIRASLKNIILFGMPLTYK